MTEPTITPTLEDIDELYAYIIEIQYQHELQLQLLADNAKLQSDTISLLWTYITSCMR